jgi:hypothetical protein
MTFDPWADVASFVGYLYHLRGRRTPNEATWVEQALTPVCQGGVRHLRYPII